MSKQRTLVLLGSGPGIGVGVASHFASQTFTHIALLSRNATRLESDVRSVQSAASSKDVVVKAYPVDLGGDSKTLEEVLQRVVSELGPPEAVVYNAARVGGGEVLEADEKSVESDWRIATLGLYTTARVLMPHLVSHASDSSRKPSLIVTSGGLYKNPYHAYFSLSLSKASQHNLTTSLAQKYSKQGVHVCAIVVHGLVKPESETFSPQNIAKTYWGVYEQGAEKGEREVWITEGKGWAPVL